MDTILEMLPFLTVALLGFLAGRHLPQLREWIARGIARYRAVAARPPGPWRWWSRLLFVVGAFAATAPVWPVVQPGDPVTNELLQPAEVAVIVPVVLLFPVAWALLGRYRPYARRVAIVLVACVLGWSLWTVTYGSYAESPNVDDGLRWYLVATGVIVTSAAVAEAWRRGTGHQVSKRWTAGVVAWAIGVAAVFVIPVVGDEETQVPPRDAIPPLPHTMTVVREEAGCGQVQAFDPDFCSRRLTIAATDGASIRDLADRLAEHLRANGWPTTGDDWSTVLIQCRRIGWLNPYELCLELRLNETTSTVEAQLEYYNRRDQVVY